MICQWSADENDLKRIALKLVKYIKKTERKKRGIKTRNTKTDQDLSKGNKIHFCPVKLFYTDFYMFVMSFRALELVVFPSLSTGCNLYLMYRHKIGIDHCV